MTGVNLNTSRAQIFTAALDEHERSGLDERAVPWETAAAVSLISAPDRGNGAPRMGDDECAFTLLAAGQPPNSALLRQLAIRVPPTVLGFDICNAKIRPTNPMQRDASAGQNSVIRHREMQPTALEGEGE
ncbi:hypothetical protein, partial [Mycolicibacterium sp. CBMA 361]|uniref:hypothetical protein n=1 Tax=Mycolicibacterium sp. CBMA 361 TaxID=2606610 RepID=UPI00193EC1DA